MKVKLTKTQIKQMAPLQQMVLDAAESGQPGTIFVQVFPTVDGYMNAKFIPNDVSEELVLFLEKYYPRIKLANKKP